MPVSLADNSRTLTSAGSFVFSEAGEYMQVIFMPSTDFGDASSESRLAMLYGMRTVIDQMTSLLTDPAPPKSEMS